MKGVRFYFDYSSNKAKRAGGDAPNALALFVENGYTPSGRREAIVGLTDVPNAPVCRSAVSDDYLRGMCKRVSESEARRVHPNLSTYLDRSES